MKRFLPSALLLAAHLVNTSTANAQPNIAQLLPLHESIVQISVELGNGNAGTGTGVVISPEYVVTNCHVIANGKGANVILDMVAGPYVGREINCLADDGRIVIIANQGGKISEVDVSQVLRRRLTITGSTLRPRSVDFKGAIARSLRAHVWPLLESKKIRPVIHEVFELEAAAKAHQLMESSQHIGKIVLIIN